MDAEIATANQVPVSLAVEKDSMDQQPLIKGHSLNHHHAMDAPVPAMNVLEMAMMTANPAIKTSTFQI